MIGKSSVFQIAFFFGCGYISPIADCLTVSEAYGQDNVVFTCVISPYTGRQIWLKDSAEVADCGFVSCFVNASNPAHYHFTHDLSSGNFTFKIESLGTTNEGSIIGCFDGTNTQEITIQKGKKQTSISKTVPITLSSNQVNNITTTGTGTNHSATLSTLSSVSILRESSPATVSKEGEITFAHVLPLIIAASCDVLISFIVLLSYYIALKKTKKPKLDNHGQSGRFHQGQSKSESIESKTTAL